MRNFCHKLALVVTIVIAMAAPRPTAAQVRVDEAAATRAVEEPNSDPLADLQQRLDAAATVQVDYLGRLTGPAGDFDWTGTMWISDQGKARIDMKQNPAVMLSIISDGQRTVVVTNDKEVRHGRHVYASSSWKHSIAFAGPGLPVLMGHLTELCDASASRFRADGLVQPPVEREEEPYMVYDLRPGPQEASWQYKMDGPPLAEGLQVTLWLDPATGLPVKREVVLEPHDPLLNQDALIHTEYYANWRLDTPIEPGRLQIPEVAD